MADLRDKLFSMRSYTPLPFLFTGLLFGRPTPASLIAGLFMILPGEAIRMWGVGHVGPETRVTGSVGASRLVISGPYAYVRNPLYIGNILLYTGIGVMSNLPLLTAITAAWFLFQYWMIVSREEEALKMLFGDDYARYCADVPRFFPRWSPLATGAGRFQLQVATRSERRTYQAIGGAVGLMLAKYLLMLVMDW